MTRPLRLRNAALIAIATAGLVAGCRRGAAPNPIDGFAAADLARMKPDEARKRLGKEAFTATDETLFNRIERGDVASVQLLLKAGVSPDATSPEGIPALVSAVNVDSPTIVTALIAGGADVNATAPGGATAIHVAAHDGRLACVDALLNTSALVVREQAAGDNPSAAATPVDPALVDADGNTALLSAIGAGHTDVALRLLGAGWDARAAGGDGDAALALAVRRGDETLLRALLDKGAPIDAKNAEGRTALSVAAAEGPLNAVRFLLAAGADASIADQRGDTPLSIARKSNRPENAALLEKAAPKS